MRKPCIFIVSLMAASGIALAQATPQAPPQATPQAPPKASPRVPRPFVEAAAIDGGENARNGEGDGSGLEVVGSFGFAEAWYAGGILGRFEQDLPGGDIESTYINLNAGRVFSVAPRTNVSLEGGLWFGQQDTDGTDTDPRALELKAGFNHSISGKLDLLGSLAWVTGDLDTDTDSDLRTYMWSAGAAYRFGQMFSMNLKMVDGFNGVNGQNQVLRLGARWTF